MTYAGTNLSQAYNFLARGLTVTEGNWPPKVIESLERYYQEGRHTSSMVAANLMWFKMSISYPPENRIDGVRWFAGWPLVEEA